MLSCITTKKTVEEYIINKFIEGANFFLNKLNNSKEDKENKEHKKLGCSV